jgi:hypothetical protein
MPLPQDTAERLLNHLNGLTPLPITGPLKLYVGNQSTMVGPQVITLSAGVRSNNSSGEDAYYESTNTAAVVFTNMPPITVNRWYIMDSSATPVKVWEDATLRIRDVPAGDSYEVPAGALKVRIVFFRGD